MNQLKGIKVLELASVLAGPGVGQFLAELGAEVIKVENLLTGGDVTRSWKFSGEQTDDRSAYFTSINWGKQSLAIDLTHEIGKEIIYKLAAQCDIVVASYKPGDAEKLGVDYSSLIKVNPSIIYGQISGYGQTNPRVGYDALIQAEAGFMFINGNPGESSLKIPVALMDVLAGHQLKQGILLALIKKMQTGEGSLVEVSLIQAAVSALVNQATNWLVGRKIPVKQGSSHPNIAPYGDVFLTEDNKEIILAVGSDKQFRTLCSVLSIEGIGNDEQFSSNTLRVRNRGALIEILATQIRRRQSQELLKKLENGNVPAGIVHDMKEVFAMPEALEMLIQTNQFPGLRAYIGKENGAFAPITSHFQPPPHLGQHTDEILTKGLGFSSSDVDLLRRKGVIR